MKKKLFEMDNKTKLLNTKIFHNDFAATHKIKVILTNQRMLECVF